MSLTVLKSHNFHSGDLRVCEYYRIIRSRMVRAEITWGEGPWV
ncbi:hypothetical protein BN2364_3329 [Alloalcanivorax xenomutans]|nr:hypothetical protein BN2364_3329 [Alloalcanivorax xenomutans]